eukprot:s2698_g4.t1
MAWMRAFAHFDGMDSENFGFVVERYDAQADLMREYQLTVFKPHKGPLEVAMYVKAAAAFCGQCGQGRPYSGVSQYSDWQSPWSSSGWQEPASPRRRGQTPWGYDQQKGDQRPQGRQKSPRQRGKAGRGGKGSGPVGEAPAANGPTTKGLKEQLPAPPTLQTPSLPVTPTGTASSHADPGLQQLLQALAQNRDDLPLGVRDLLDSQKEVDSRAHAKNLHKLVAAQGAARRQLAQARSGRQDYMREWAQYVSDICKIWEVQLDEKNKALQTFQEAAEQWERQLNDSTQQIARLATETEGTQAIDVDSMSDQDAQEAQDAHINELARQEVAIDVDSMSDQDAQEAQDAHINELARQEVQRQAAQERLRAVEAKISTSLQEARAAAESQVNALPKSERERSPRRRAPLDVKDTKEPKDKDKPGADGAKPGEASKAGAVPPQ